MQTKKTYIFWGLIVIFATGIFLISLRLYRPDIFQKSEKQTNSIKSPPAQAFTSYLEKAGKVREVQYLSENGKCFLTANQIKIEAASILIENDPCASIKNNLIMSDGGYIVYQKIKADTLPTISIYNTETGADVILQRTEPLNAFYLEKIDEDKFRLVVLGQARQDGKRAIIENRVFSNTWLFEDFPNNTIYGDRFSDAGRYMGTVE